MDLTALERLPLWIAGGAVAARTQRYGEVTNPATGEVIRHVPLGNAEDVDAAVRAAAGALAPWSAAPALRRARILMRFRDLLETHKKDLARLVSEEHGKTLIDAEGSITRGIEVVEFATGIPHLLKGEFSDNVGSGVDGFSLRQAVGVCAGITPFNFPAMVPMWMFPVALACGNTFILKPSERDPTMSLRMAELLKEAGLPDGVFNVVHGDKEAVDAILVHPGIRAVSFVGSTPVARHIYETGTRHGKRVQALGGAKNHAVVMPDADLDFAADALIGAAYGSAGERCMAVSVVVAVGDAADPIRDRLAGRARRVAVGPGDRRGIRDGPGDHLRRARPHRRADRPRCRRRGDARRRRSRASRAGSRRGVFRGSDAVRSRHYRHVDLSRGDLRARAGDRARRFAGAGDRPDQRECLRQRRGAVHALRACRAALPAGRRGRHDRHQRPDPGADGVTTRSADGGRRCSATCTCTAWMACASIPAARRSRRAGRTTAAPPPDFTCRRWADAVSKVAETRRRVPPRRR